MRLRARAGEGKGGVNAAAGARARGRGPRPARLAEAEVVRDDGVELVAEVAQAAAGLAADHVGDGLQDALAVLDRAGRELAQGELACVVADLQRGVILRCRSFSGMYIKTRIRMDRDAKDRV